ncbi:aspartate/glutamate racemase family protein [Glacieibacterium megasporae]|uniref:aspartate/glutamate racemase family protein n=1 Tax=Glacieibacterium megasporae TaxID=2835787 RepID=UPI001C1E6B9B|nr:amino acid racemase [Polymorphobacter megasporae]UAJ10171.1 amino acid racemase [Polymorphobacter megasporae]
MTKTVGVIGGMGPAATLDFLDKLHHATGAVEESDHLRVITDNNPRHADRNAAMVADGPSPAGLLAETARGLAAAGAEFLVMPCNAAHSWAADIIAATPLPFVSMIDAAVATVVAAVPEARIVGLLAVEATQASRIYHNGFEAAGIAVIAPDMAAFMPLIYAVKRGDTGPAVRAAMAAQAQLLVEAGADVILAACTEVPLVFAPGDIAAPVVSATDALVGATLAAARSLSG